MGVMTVVPPGCGAIPMVCVNRGRDQKAGGTGWPALHGVSLLGSQPAAPSCLGRGRFGQVHRCTEKSTGLSLAAKIIKVKSAKDRVRQLPWASQYLGPRSGLLCFLLGPLAPCCPRPRMLIRNNPATFPASFP